MSRQRMTKRRSPQAKSIMAEIKKLMADIDAELEAEADAIADEEKAIAEESTDYPVEMGENQNDKAMDNWPVDGNQEMANEWTAAERAEVSASLIKLAKALLED